MQLWDSFISKDSSYDIKYKKIDECWGSKLDFIYRNGFKIILVWLEKNKILQVASKEKKGGG